MQGGRRTEASRPFEDGKRADWRGFADTDKPFVGK